MTQDVFMLAARRTVVAPRGGALSKLEPHEMAAPVIGACLQDAGLSVQNVDEVILSNALGAGGNPARMAAIAANLPMRVGGLSIDRQCAGGLDAIHIGRALIASGQASVVIAGGAESFSRRPYRARVEEDGSLTPYARPPFAPDPSLDPDLATAADHLAAALGITREEQDAYAVESHAKALAARQDMQAEIACLAGTETDTDPFARRLTNKLCARAGVISGTVTSANTAVEADGAAFVILSSKPIGPSAVRVLATSSLGGDPCMPALAPVHASEDALKGAGVPASDLAQAEIMEAYAVQAMAVRDQLGLVPAIVNPRGGALARGHPIGASGAVLAVRLFHDLHAGQTGLATIAAAGGLGSALVLRR